MRYIFIAIIVFFSCSEKPDEKSFADKQKKSDAIEYAKGFDIEQYNNHTKLIVNKPYQGATEKLTYYLIPHDQEIPDSLKDVNIIRTPVEKMVATSTSHIPMLDYLDATEALAGFPTLDYISSEKMRAHVDSGLVKELGRDDQLNYEVLVKLQPDLVMSYMLSADRTHLDKIEQAGIPVMINADYLEHHPLGRAEWIKVMGALLNKKELADSVFTVIEKSYQDLQQKVENINYHPSVMTGIMYGDTWYLPGGENYAAHLFKDAGLNYLWQENEEHGFLELNFESVYSKARNADLWLGVASFRTKDELQNADSRYTWFDAYKKDKIYSYTAKIGATGGNEYLELGYLRPDIILADLIQIGHPDLLTDRELYFYKKINGE